MARKPPGRNRPDNVALRPFLSDFLARLARVTHWGGDTSCYTNGPRLTGASPENRGCPYDSRGYAVGYLFQEIMSKFNDGCESVTKTETTWQRFKAAEDLCASTNQRLQHATPPDLNKGLIGVDAVIHTAQRKIEHVLGRFSWNAAYSGMSFTTGASTSLPRRFGHQAYKYSSKLESTFNNLDLATTCVTLSPLWNGRPLFAEGPCDRPEIGVVDGNKLISVPKNYKTDRTIAIEPSLNMYVQKGIGVLIRRKLRKVGIDLNHGQQTNRDLAKFASVTGHLATVDLSMASDTVSLELVRLLLPADWCSALEQCRAPYGVLPSGQRILYRKFSSMGNGYTFELESLLFWALCSAATELLGLSTSLVSVYGDDLIVPTLATPLLYDVLSYCGFKVNESKSFVSGAFRESCGKHYLNGVDVSPFYVKSEDRSLLGLFKLHNQAARWFKQLERHGISFPGRSELLSSLRDLAPVKWRRPRIPDGMGDGAFIGSFDECQPDRPVAVHPQYTGWEGWFVIVLSETASASPPLVLVDRQHPGLTLNGAFCEQLERTGFNEPGGGLVLRRRVRRIQIVVPHFEW